MNLRFLEMRAAGVEGREGWGGGRGRREGGGSAGRAREKRERGAWPFEKSESAETTTLAGTPRHDDARGRALASAGGRACWLAAGGAHSPMVER
jgi:hypothetical protein